MKAVIATIALLAGNAVATPIVNSAVPSRRFSLSPEVLKCMNDNRCFTRETFSPEKRERCLRCESPSGPGNAGQDNEIKTSAQDSDKVSRCEWKNGCSSREIWTAEKKERCNRCKALSGKPAQAHKLDYGNIVFPEE
ncbi:hypothetical protein CDD80_3637 [Ophiocordyceps camponoti-rufipedis]|uniref:ShKT domain-containing protein n=1 Tax=Ophiocordyceps camponoti-rufipedis TaxID=2004952 RepID=A0A2C5Z104_9HYPO|nr:hypothetical protein CDD80_3637 [Ophiocordyceps camponoti-rufipedis]